MTKQQVLLSWGEPYKFVIDSLSENCKEKWIYGSQYLCFYKDSVIFIGFH